jgi:putative transposase
MPRFARIKSPDYIYHIMCRSISEFNLFRDEDDKNYYLSLLKKYKEKFHCKIYAYCLMDTHMHVHIDPQGFDISKFMLCLNTSYVLYYNKKYNRHGHVFQGRYESRVVSTDAYSLAVSAYIHNNPKDIEGYNGREYEYPFSSMGIYLRQKKDILGLIDRVFILGLFNSTDPIKAVQQYYEFVRNQKDMATDKSITKCLARMAVNQYRDDRHIIYRDFKPLELIAKIAGKLEISCVEMISIKSNKNTSDFRSICSFILRSLCGCSYKDLCKLIGNMSLSGISRLCNKGYELITEHAKYKIIFDEIVRVA